MAIDGLQRPASPYSAALIRRAVLDSFLKLDPRVQIRNPVMFVVEVGSVLTTLLFVQALGGRSEEPAGFIGWVAAWLWFTILFANFAEAVAEGRGKAQAAALRRMRRETVAKRLRKPVRGAPHDQVSSSQLRQGDVFLAEAGDTIAADGEVIEGIASVDESAITGESAPEIRESGGDRSAVTGGTRVLSDWLIIRVTANPGEGFLDRMIRLVEGARRQKTPNEIALNILLAGFSIIFLLVCATLQPYSAYSVTVIGKGNPVTITGLVALLVCLIPTTIGGLLSAIGIAGMDRMIRRNVIATSGRAVEAAADVDVLMLDKTGTITLGNRQAVEFVPLAGTDPHQLAEWCQLASLSDETPEGRSIVALAREKYGLTDEVDPGTTFIPFSAMTRMSGVDLNGAQDGKSGIHSIRKGASDSVAAYVAEHGGTSSDELKTIVNGIASVGSTPLVVAEVKSGADGADGHARVLGVIELKDIVKGGMRTRFDELRRMGIRTIMITGDNQLSAAAIAKESGVD